MDFENLKALYEMGLSIHWLYPKSKRPIGENWSSGPRKSWDHLTKTFKKGNNVGVRTGTTSKFPDGTYLVILDIDVKSDDKKDTNHAYKIAEKFIGKRLQECTVVRSGRGGDSIHVYLRTKKASASFNVDRSDKVIKVKMPSVQPGKKEMQTLTEKEVNDGFRLRSAFEIDVLADGKQAVIPPSIHPDTKKEYVWGDDEWMTRKDGYKLLTLIDESKFKKLEKLEKPQRVSFVEVDLDKIKLKPKWIDLIKELKGVENYKNDRSIALYAVIFACTRLKLSDSQIVSMLTDPNNAISEVALSRKANSFEKAQDWLLPQIEKARRAESPEKFFEEMDLHAEMKERGWLPEIEPGKDVRDISDDLEGWKADLDRSAGGGFKMNLKNTVLFLRKSLEVDSWLAMNEFTGGVEIVGEMPGGVDKKKGSWLTDADAISIRHILSKKHGFEPTTHLMWEALNECARLNKFHPVRDYLNSLVWDKKPRIDTWLIDYMKAEDNAYTRAVGRKMLVAAVSRVMEPGCKFDQMVILEGNQGIGKSTALRVLGGEWFCDSLGDVTNKDVIGQIQGSWIVEIPELASLDRATVSALKDFISKQADKARLAYERSTKIFPRQCVLVGTTNDEEYLKDVTGNRRFWPIEVGENVKFFKIEQLKKNRNQLWAEAFFLYKKGTEKLWLDDEESLQISHQKQASKMITDPWDEDVRKWLSEKAKKLGQKSSANLAVRGRLFWTEVVGRDEISIKKYDEMRISSAFKKLGFTRIRFKNERIWAGKEWLCQREVGKMPTILR